MTRTYDIKIQPFNNRPEYAPHYIVKAEDRSQAALFAHQASLKADGSWGHIVSLVEIPER